MYLLTYLLCCVGNLFLDILSKTACLCDLRLQKCDAANFVSFLWNTLYYSHTYLLTFTIAVRNISKIRVVEQTTMKQTNTQTWRHKRRSVMEHWGTCTWSLRMHANFAAVQILAALIFLPSSVSSKLDRQSHQLLWQAVAKNFSHIRFCRPNARCLSLLDDFVTTNYGTRVPRARAPLEQNSGDATDVDISGYTL